LGIALLRLPVFVAALLASAAAHAQCTPLEPVSPRRDATVTDARPEIAWPAAAGAKSYRVQIESRVPEGRVIERLDARVAEPRFVPPRPLAEDRAAVKVVVTADCATPPNIASQPAWFYVDAAAACPPAEALAFTGGAARWRGTAARYEVEVFFADDGRLLARQDTPVTSLRLPAAPGPVLVAVRPRCGTVLGPALYGRAPARP
jgi:hypothetical protein